MKAVLLFAIAILVGHAQFAFSATLNLENSKSKYQVLDASGNPQGYIEYEFVNRVGDRIDLVTTTEELDGSISQIERNVSMQDYILAHDLALKAQKNCTTPVNYMISNKSILGCRRDGSNGFMVESADVPMTIVESFLVNENCWTRLIEFIDGK